ncbi:hypothetical protein ACQ4LE_010390 [Meloidogyne hapla]
MLRNKLELCLINLILLLLYSIAKNDFSEEENNYEDSDSSVSKDSKKLRYKSIEKINKINEGDNEESKISSSKNKINKNKREGTNNLCDIIAKAKLAQINKCQNKLFGNEAKIKREYFLDEKSQNKIIKNFIKENLEFKQAIARYKENISCDEINSEIEETFTNGLCILYLYGNINARNLKFYFKINYTKLKTKLHSRKIRFFDERANRKNDISKNEIIKKIEKILEIKSNEKCGGKWEINENIHFLPLEAKQFFIKILNLAKDVEEKIKKLKNNFLEAIYGNGLYHILINSDDVKIQGNKQNILMFMTKFRGIIYDFYWELIWSFKYSTKIYVYNPEKSAERICDLLSFRALLEFLNSITKIKFFNANLNHVEVVNNLIKLFEEYNEKPEEFYNLNLNEKYSENIKNMVTRKVSDFIKNYIDGKLNVIVDRLEKN